MSVPGMMEARVAGRKWVSGPSFFCLLSFFPPSRDPSLPPSLLPSAVLDVSFERWTFVSSFLPDACPRMPASHVPSLCGPAGHVGVISGFSLFLRGTRPEMDM